jgi:acetamidase/formamidase
VSRHRLDPGPATLHGVLSSDLLPALTVRSGDVVSARIPDAAWARIEQIRPIHPARVDRHPLPGPDHDGHCLIGPIEVLGARAGMTLEVVIRKLRTADWGWTCAGGFPYRVNELLDLEAQETTWITWEIAGDVAREAGGASIPVRPFLGFVGMPPAEPGLHSSTPPRAWGGNLDCRELVVGSRLQLPIPVDGAMLSLGDGHAAQGDGEASGVAVECGMEEVEVELILRPELRIDEPRAITPAGRMTLAVDSDLNRAWERALAAMIDWMVELYGLDRARALALASVVVDLRITQVANGVCGVHALLRDDRIEGL